MRYLNTEEGDTNRASRDREAQDDYGGVVGEEGMIEMATGKILKREEAPSRR